MTQFDRSAKLGMRSPNELMARIHDEKLRMPAVLRESDHDSWLQGNPAQATAALTPYPGDEMLAWQVGRRLYATKTANDASLIAPADEPGAQAIPTAQ